MATFVRLFTPAASLGGVESLISHPPSLSHKAFSPEERKAAGINDGLVRVSAGIEHPDDLVADMKQAAALLARQAATTAVLSASRNSAPPETPVVP